ncbi:xaa-Pro aminopeptidase 1 (AMPP) [Vairimorpha necatrix]|uniref:Xaa-Pro aminopeptidase 1 (AMPP) n=1 Tax=Vairimorpha necatrix TaxID=6039 RepID=A0AAX4J959_9MICR
MINSLLNKYNLGGYINITADEHLNEYIGPSDKRVEFLTGFTGSNGLAVTCKNNALFTDSRYYLQAEKELTNYKMKKMGIDSLEEYLRDNIEIKRVGLNPRHYTTEYIKTLTENLSKHAIELVQITEDFVDEIYAHKPVRIFNKVYSIENYKICDFYKENFKRLGINENYRNFMIYKDLEENAIICGKTYQEKIKEIREEINEDEELIITEMDTICWVFNLRGSDIKYNPLFYAYASLNKKEVRLFCNAEIKLENVEICKYEDFENFLFKNTNKFVVSNTCNGYLNSLLKSPKYTDKIRLCQSQKTREELEGFNLAYILDGVALNKLFVWINKNENVTEKQVSEKLDEIKSEFYGYKFPSFESIVGAGSNSAIIHYSAGEEQIKNDQICLLDVGSNYIFGTTDTSRTLFLGKVNEKIKTMYTKILKGQIRAMSQIYPKNINGCIIDSLTRLDLWNKFENYGHASGHGVGHFLCVHEGPPTLSYNFNSKILLNQVFSIEPGIYYDGEFGIRLENLVFSQEVDDKFMRLVNLTYVPYQWNMIDSSLLEEEEINNINSVFEKIREKILPLISTEEEREYLLKNTSKIIKKN